MIDIKEIKAKVDKWFDNKDRENLNLMWVKDVEAIEIAKRLAQGTLLKDLALRGGEISSDGAKALARVLKTNKTLTTIDLRANKIGNEGAIALADALEVNQTLTDIDLGKNEIGAAGAKALARTLKINNVLTTLDLRTNNIGAPGADVLAEALKTNKTLTSIILWGNNLGSSGAIKLAEALKVNQSLTTIHLSGNNLGPEDAKALAEALKTNQTLTDIELGDNNFGLEGAKALVEMLKTNQTLKSISIGCSYKPSPDDEKIGKEMAALITRNKAIQAIRKKISISSLFVDSPFSLPCESADVKGASEVSKTASSADSKENSEIRLLEAHQSLQYDCEQLEKLVCSETIVQELRDEIDLALCSWDTYGSSELRIEKLMEITLRNNKNLGIKENALSLLAHNFFTKAMVEDGAEETTKKTLLLSAYLCALYGRQDRETADITTSALCLWMGYDIRKMPFRSHTELLENFFKANPEQFQNLKTVYTTFCTTLALQPLSMLEDIRKKPVTPIVFSAGAGAAAAASTISSTPTEPSLKRRRVVEQQNTSTGQQAGVLASRRAAELGSLDEDEVANEANKLSVSKPGS